ncbi:MAG: VCBS repeat-containing protein [Verrucomicrobiales bacterium]
MKTTPLTAFASISALAALSAIAWLPAAAFAQKFEAQTIDAKVAIGYGLAIGDVDGDGKPDVLLADKREIVWYENPEWKRHIMAKNLTTLDNVCIAARDLDGDGKVEVACGAMWNPGETDDPAKSGSLHYLIRPGGDPRGAWQPVRIQPHDPTVHRMHWARLGDGKWGLAVAPLHGRGNRGGKGENGARLQVYPLPADPADGSAWKPATLSERMHATHNFDVIPAESGAEAFALAGAEGIQQVKAGCLRRHRTRFGSTRRNMARRAQARCGSVESEGDVCRIEPMHGNELVVYSPADGGGWKRSVLIDSMNQGTR